MEKILVILNPTSGRGSGARAVESIRRALGEVDLAFDLFETTRAEEAIEVAREAKLSGYGIVAAAGGDGTVSEVVNGLALAAAPGTPVGRLALLPVGTGNDFCDMIGANRDLRMAARAIRNRRVKRVDLGRVHLREENRTLSRYFDNNLGLGFEAQVTVESRKITRLRGFLVYLLAVFKALRKFDQPHLQVAWRDESGKIFGVDQRALLVSVGNGRRTGGGFYITPDAEMDDGLLDLGIANAMRVPQMLRLLPLTLFGAHRHHPAIRLVRCRSLSVISDRPVPVHADGEVLSERARAVSVTIEAGRLEVIV